MTQTDSVRKNNIWILAAGSAVCILGPAFLVHPKPWIAQLLLLGILFVGFDLWERKTDSGSLETLPSLPEEEIQNLLELNRTHGILLELSNSLMSIRDTDALLQTILTKAIEVVPAGKYGSILVLNGDDDLEYKAIYGFDTRLYSVKMQNKESFQWRMTEGHFVEPMVIENISQYGKTYMEDDTYDTMMEIKALTLQSTLSAPILINGEFYGSINIDSVESDAFSDQDITLMKYFANQAASVIQNHQLFEKTLYLSRYDALTGINNRRHFEELFEKYVQTAHRPEASCSLMVMDLNGLKSVNDTLGHWVGDQMLQTFCQKFRETFSERALFARYGGDEFVAVFFRCGRMEAEERLGRFRIQLLSNPIMAGKHEVWIDFSYGASEFPVESETYQGLVRLADERMYARKTLQKSSRSEDLEMA